MGLRTGPLSPNRNGNENAQDGDDDGADVRVIKNHAPDSKSGTGYGEGWVRLEDVAEVAGMCGRLKSNRGERWMVTEDVLNEKTVSLRRIINDGVESFSRYGAGV